LQDLSKFVQIGILVRKYTTWQHWTQSIIVKDPPKRLSHRRIYQTLSYQSIPTNLLTFSGFLVDVAILLAETKLGLSGANVTKEIDTVLMDRPLPRGGTPFCGTLRQEIVVA
jgi:hypothetical protein